ncbi:MAG: hypothetical protein FRX49_06166 [Trebouxia sp. A1-2]|nr:MAG: hypothetical protein FRX49_06166 [Trebouxia sp. A1-2]
MVPQTPVSTGRQWTVFRSQDFDAGLQPESAATSTSNAAELYSHNPGFDMGSPRTVQASSPWPDVIMASQLDCAPRFSDPPRRFPNDFRVEIPQSQLAENSLPHDRFPATSSSDSPPDDRPQLNLQRGADVYSAHKFQPDKASSHEPTRRNTPGTRSCPGSSTRMGMFWHVASLSFAANPVRSHREWAGVIDRITLPEPAAPKGSASPRVGALIQCLHRDFTSPNGQGRFVRLESLEEAYATNKKRRRLAYALRRKQNGSGYKGVWDRLSNDLFIIGEVAFDRCTPRKLHGHAPWWTLMLVATCLVTFAYMAAQWPSFVGSEGSSSLCSQQAWPQGPRSLWDWLVQWNTCRRFDDDYLVLWGARYIYSTILHFFTCHPDLQYGPKMTQGQNAYRWFSSLLLYKDFIQLSSNLLLFLALGVHLERRFGTRRLIILTMIAGVGGNFFSAAFEGLCHVYSSGSGATFGMLVLFIADMAFNFETIRFPIMRILAAAILLGVFIAAAVVRGLPARLSVLGGALTALFPVLSLLPHLKSEKFEWWIPYMSLITTCGFLLALPLYVYLKRLPGISC